VDYRFFFLKRMNFIRQFYDVASKPYAERKSAIENEEAPWIPPYSEDSEPAFLSEWLEADESIQILGVNCISMLSAALKLFLQECEKRVGIPRNPAWKSVFRRSWLQGYSLYFGTHVGKDFARSGVNLEILEEAVLARNNAQHPASLLDTSLYYSASDLSKLSSPVLVRNYDAKAHAEDRQWGFMLPSIHVTEASLEKVLVEAERLANWLED